MKCFLNLSFENLSMLSSIFFCPLGFLFICFYVRKIPPREHSYIQQILINHLLLLCQPKEDTIVNRTDTVLISYRGTQAIHKCIQNNWQFKIYEVNKKWAPGESEFTSFRESDQEKPLKTCMTQTGGGGGDVSRYKQHVQSCDEHSRVKHFTAKALSGGKNLIHQIQSGKGLLWWSSG